MVHLLHHLRSEDRVHYKCVDCPKEFTIKELVEMSRNEYVATIRVVD